MLFHYNKGKKITFWCSSFDLNSISSGFIKYKGVDSSCSICESHLRRFPILISNCLIANIVSSNFLFLKIKKFKRYTLLPFTSPSSVFERKIPITKIDTGTCLYRNLFYSGSLTPLRFFINSETCFEKWI